MLMLLLNISPSIDLNCLRSWPINFNGTLSLLLINKAISNNPLKFNHVFFYSKNNS